MTEPVGSVSRTQTLVSQDVSSRPAQDSSTPGMSVAAPVVTARRPDPVATLGAANRTTAISAPESATAGAERRGRLREFLDDESERVSLGVVRHEVDPDRLGRRDIVRTTLELDVSPQLDVGPVEIEVSPGVRAEIEMPVERDADFDLFRQQVRVLFSELAKKDRFQEAFRPSEAAAEIREIISQHDLPIGTKLRWTLQTGRGWELDADVASGGRNRRGLLTAEFEIASDGLYYSLDHTRARGHEARAVALTRNRERAVRTVVKVPLETRDGRIVTREQMDQLMERVVHGEGADIGIPNLEFHRLFADSRNRGVFVRSDLPEPDLSVGFVGEFRSNNRDMKYMLSSVRFGEDPSQVTASFQAVDLERASDALRLSYGVQGRGPFRSLAKNLQLRFEDHDYNVTRDSRQVIHSMDTSDSQQRAHLDALLQDPRAALDDPSYAVTVDTRLELDRQSTRLRLLNQAILKSSTGSWDYEVTKTFGPGADGTFVEVPEGTQDAFAVTRLQLGDGDRVIREIGVSREMETLTEEYAFGGSVFLVSDADGNPVGAVTQAGMVFEDTYTRSFEMRTIRRAARAVEHATQSAPTAYSVGRPNRLHQRPISMLVKGRYEDIQLRAYTAVDGPGHMRVVRSHPQTLFAGAARIIAAAHETSVPGPVDSNPALVDAFSSWEALDAISEWTKEGGARPDVVQQADAAHGPFTDDGIRNAAAMALLSLDPHRGRQDRRSRSERAQYPLTSYSDVAPALGTGPSGNYSSVQQRAKDNYERHYRRLTGRSLQKDWNQVYSRTLSVREMFDRDPWRTARHAKELTPETIATLMGDFHTTMRQRRSANLETLVFWLALSSAAGPEHFKGYFEVTGDKVDIAVGDPDAVGSIVTARSHERRIRATERTMERRVADEL